MTRSVHLKRGFTLTESMIALTLCALVLAAAYPLLTSTTWKLYQARDHYAATTICLAQIERARNIPYEQLESALGFENQIRVNELGAVDPAGRFRRTTTVSVNNPDPGVTKVIVNTDIMDRSTGTFRGQGINKDTEVQYYLFTEYLKPMDTP